MAADDGISERGRLIWKLADLLEAHTEEFGYLESLDNGKPLAIAKAADVPLAVDLFRYMAGWATKIEGNTIPLSVPYTPGAKYLAYTVREPVGVNSGCLELSPADGSMEAGTCAGLRLYGRFEASRANPAFGTASGRTHHGSRVPEGVVNIVPGYGETAGAALAAHPDVDKNFRIAAPVNVTLSSIQTRARVSANWTSVTS